MGAITSQNDATPKLLGGRIAPGRERLPVKTTLLQNSRSSTETLIHERLPVKTTLLQNVQRKISFVFIERLPVKTTLLQNPPLPKPLRVFERLPVKTTLLQNAEEIVAVNSQERLPVKTTLLQNLGFLSNGSYWSDYQSKRRYSKTPDVMYNRPLRAITSQNDATPKQRPPRIGGCMERLPVKTTLLQNSTAKRFRPTSERLPVKTTLLQNNYSELVGREMSDYQSKRRYSKTEDCWFR